jgi:hypothetical protein
MVLLIETMNLSKIILMKTPKFEKVSEIPSHKSFEYNNKHFKVLQAYMKSY